MPFIVHKFSRKDLRLVSCLAEYYIEHDVDKAGGVCIRHS